MVKYVRGVTMKGIIAVVTYNCNIMCSSCSYGCGPHRKGIMSPECFKEKVMEAYDKGYTDYLEICGGEPFLHTGIVFKYLKKIRDININKIVVTNGFWGKMDNYTDIIMYLRKRGIAKVILEYDSFHSVFIDQETILAAVRKCSMCGIDVVIRAVFQTSNLSTPYDLKTLDIMRSIRKRWGNLVFECKTAEHYRGLYSHDEKINKLLILPKA